MDTIAALTVLVVIGLSFAVMFRMPLLAPRSAGAASARRDGIALMLSLAVLFKLIFSGAMFAAVGFGQATLIVFCLLVLLAWWPGLQVPISMAALGVFFIDNYVALGGVKAIAIFGLLFVLYVTLARVIGPKT